MKWTIYQNSKTWYGPSWNVFPQRDSKKCYTHNFFYLKFSLLLLHCFFSKVSHKVHPSMYVLTITMAFILWFQCYAKANSCCIWVFREGRTSSNNVKIPPWFTFFFFFFKRQVKFIKLKIKGSHSYKANKYLA